MSFINPSFFWFLPLVTLPVIIHILNRPRKRIIVFPAVKFLLPATRKIIRKFKLLQLLLLLLRVLFILLLITAFARPVRRTPLARETVDNFILIDTSYSMAFKTGRESALDTAKDLAGELIDKIPGRFAVAEFNSKLNFITYLSDERARAKDAVEQIKLSPYTTDYASIIKELTETSLVKENIDKNIIILSDFNRAGFKDEEKIPDIENASYMLIEVARGNENIWIENIETQEAYINTPLKINGFIRSNNSAETELYMYINGERRGNKKIEAGKEEEFTFKPVFREEGNYRGKIELQTSMEHNRLAPDDIRYFSFKVKPQIRVLLVDGRPGYTLMSSESYFVDRALSAARYRAPASARVITPEELKTIDLDYYDVLYLLNATVDSEITNKINNFTLINKHSTFFKYKK
ncbi:MAG: vWA domain-containing protein [Elusimicrobiota bacterium]